MTTLQTALTVAATATATATLAAGKHTPVDATTGALTMTLPTPARIGARLRVERIDTSANTVTVTGTIRGATSSVTLLGQYDQIEFAAESTTSWRVAAAHRPKIVNDALYAPKLGGTVLGERYWDLTGYTPPQTTSSAQVKLHAEGVTFTVPASGWVRISLSGVCWTSDTSSPEDWCVLTATDTVASSQMAMQGDPNTSMRRYEMVTNMKGQSARMVPGETLTFYWGWNAPKGGTIFLDGSVSIMRVEAAVAPTLPAAGALTTPENVATVTGSTASLTASYAATPAAGDLMLAVFMANVVNTSWTLPTGWATAVVAQVGTGARYVGICYKVAGASEPTSLTFSATAATVTGLHLWSKRGFSTTPALDRTGTGSVNSYTDGNKYDTTGTIASAPSYAVGAVGGGGSSNITRVSNGWANLWSDGTQVIPIQAAEKVLVYAGTSARVNPAQSATTAMGAAIATFTGV